MIFCNFQKSCDFGYSQNTLLSIVGKLEGGGSVAVAVGVGDM